MNDPYSYDPAVFFDSFYRTQNPAGLLTDQQTIGDLPARFVRHHYNSLENLIMESLSPNFEPGAYVLDFGAGAGHWTDFALDMLEAGGVDQVEISPRALESLGWLRWSSAVEQFDRLFKTFTNRYDAIFAIGVMFHIVRDERWASTLAALIRRLSPEGFLFCSGSFVGETRDVQYHSTDEFSNWGECYWTNDWSARFVHKRLRSFEDWTAAVENAGGVIQTRWFNRAPEGYVVPENNLLVIRKRK